MAEAKTTPTAAVSKEEKERSIKNMQERLKLLRHAARCNYPDVCLHAPFCRNMKNLWVHLTSCQDDACIRPHCFSSRNILTHYNECETESCEICVPIKLAIKKEQEFEVATWQVDSEDKDDRLLIIRHIVTVLRRMKKNPTKEWLERLPITAKAFELRLYRSAATKEIYNDLSTLKERMRKIYADIKGTQVVL
jgi:hypothetical protein